MKNGNPHIKATRLKYDICISNEVNAPLKKSAWIMGSPNKTNPQADGNAMSSVKIIARSISALYSARESALKSLAKVGNNTVPRAIAKTPRGNCSNLSDTYNQVGLPVTNKEAKIVSISKFN